MLVKKIERLDKKNDEGKCRKDKNVKQKFW